MGSDLLAQRSANAPVEFTNLVFIDETGLQLGMTPDYGRAPSGERVYGVAPYRHGQMITRRWSN